MKVFLLCLALCLALASAVPVAKKKSSTLAGVTKHLKDAMRIQSQPASKKKIAHITDVVKRLKNLGISEVPEKEEVFKKKEVSLADIAQHLSSHYAPWKAQHDVGLRPVPGQIQHHDAEPVKEPRLAPQPAPKRMEVAECAFSASVSEDRLGASADDNYARLTFDDVRVQRPLDPPIFVEGQFIAPVSGYYNLNVACTSALYRHIGLRMLIGGAQVAAGFDNYADYSSGSTSLSYVAFLAKDVAVEIQWNDRNSYGIRGGGYCIFSGSYIGSDA